MLKNYGVLRKVVDKTQIYKLESVYQFRDTHAVLRFLDDYPQLVNFLRESHYYLQKHFGSDARFTIDIFADPEVASPQIQLFVYIVTNLPSDEALAQLGKFDDEWFLDRIDLVGELLNFNLEVV